MFSTNFKGEAVFVIDEAWDGRSDLQGEFTVMRDTQVSLTRRGTRRPYSASLLTTLRYGATATGAALRQLQGSLKALTTERVIVPFWPAMTRWADRAGAAISGGLRIAWKDDWSQFEIYAATDAEPGWPGAGDNFAPALMGLLKPTGPDLLTPDAATVGIEVAESSVGAYALAPMAVGMTAGPQPAGYGAAPPLLPFEPDFQKVSEQIQVEVIRRRDGFVREQTQEFYPHSPFRSQLASYTLTGNDIGKMLRFFRDTGGQGDAFWAAGFLRVAELTQDAVAADTVLNVSDTNGVAIGDYVALADGTNFIARKVIYPLTAYAITLDAAVGANLSADWTRILPLCLASLDKPLLAVSWASPGIARCELQWTEELPEVLIPGNETLGTTIGKLPTRVALLQFTRDFGNGTTSNSYWTTFEADISYAGHDWLHKGFTVGDVPQSLNLTEDSIEISCDLFAGHPFADDVALVAEAPLQVTIRFADYDGASVTNARIVFTGDTAGPSRDGNKLTVTCKTGPAILQSELPLLVRGTMCSHIKGGNFDGTHLISTGCTGPDNLMLKANWKFSATVAGPISQAFPFALHLAALTGVGANAAAALAAAAIFADWFAFGWIEWGAGANIQRRFIIGSTVPAGGAMAVTLHRYFKSIPNVGDGVTFYPGCDGAYGTCKAYDADVNPSGKFGNGLNFGGDPFTPIGNPLLTGPADLGTQGGKK